MRLTHGRHCRSLVQLGGRIHEASIARVNLLRQRVSLQIKLSTLGKRRLDRHFAERDALSSCGGLQGHRWPRACQLKLRPVRSLGRDLRGSLAVARNL